MDYTPPTLYPPTPTLIENVNIEDIFNDERVIQHFTDLKLAIYYMANPHITSEEKQKNWLQTTSILSKVTKEAISIRRKRQANMDFVKKYDITTLRDQLVKSS